MVANITAHKIVCSTKLGKSIFLYTIIMFIIKIKNQPKKKKNK